MIVSRAREVEDVADEHRIRWLAGQVDEVEAKLLGRFTELSAAVTTLSGELVKTRDSMTKSSNRVVWTILTATVTLLVSVMAVILTGSIK